MKKNPYQKTIYACFIGYIVQAIVINFTPLLFVMFQTSYHIPLEKITLLVTFNFAIQLLVDLVAGVWGSKIGYRPIIVMAHAFSALGLIFLAILPDLFTDPFTGLFIAVITFAIGGGLIEVLVSPIMEACPTDNKEKAMSLLHSFYSWGQAGVILLSTVFFAVFGIENWKALSILWALVPVLNGILFFNSPIAILPGDAHGGNPLKGLFRSGLFWVLVLMMLSAGASEQAVSQWASNFAEKGLGISKTLGDLAGPMAFAIMMAVSRVFFGKFGDKINLSVFMQLSSLLCVASYLLIFFAPDPAIGLAGCALTGIAVGIMWPGTLSRATATMQGGTTVMFALLAVSGDIGCTVGPTVTGIVSSYFDNNLKTGIFAAVIFPLLLLAGIFISNRLSKRQHST